MNSSDSRTNTNTEEYLLRTTQVNGKNYHEVLTIEELDHGFGFIKRKIQREVREGIPVDSSGEKVTPPLNGKKAHYERIFPILEGNLNSYKRRHTEREGWSEDFVKNRLQDGWEYLDDSIYVEIENKQTGNVTGGIRFILSPYQFNFAGDHSANGEFVQKHYGPVSGFRKTGEELGPEGLPRPPSQLPEERELGIKLDPVSKDSPTDSPKFDGLKMEVGALWVDESLPPKERAAAWGELWIEILQTAHMHPDPKSNYYSQEIHAYADRLSKRLYLPLGLELTPNFSFNGKAMSYYLADAVEPIVKKDGSKWWPIVYHPENIEAFFKAWRDGAYPAKDNASVKPQLDRLRALRKLPPSLLEPKAIAADLTSKDAERKKLALHDIELLMNHYQIHSDQWWEPGAGYEISDRAMRNLQALEPVRAALEKLLKNKRITATTDEKAELDRSIKDLQVTADNQMLSLGVIPATTHPLFSPSTNSAGK